MANFLQDLQDTTTVVTILVVSDTLEVEQEDEIRILNGDIDPSKEMLLEVLLEGAFTGSSFISYDKIDTMVTGKWNLKGVRTRF